MRLLQLLKQPLSPCVPCTIWLLHRQRILFLAPRHDAKRTIRQWPLQRLRLGPWRGQPGLPFPCSVRITGIALGWTAATSAFGAEVRKPKRSA